MSKKYYRIGSERAFRWMLDEDVRGYRPPLGWEARAVLIDQHPYTGGEFKDAPQWWIIEKYTGAEE